MKVRLYIVTYLKPEILNRNLSSLWTSLSGSHDLSVTILSNHPEVHITPENQRPGLRVILNTTRSRYSWGSLARDWNFALLDGFVHWSNPDHVDWCVLAQNDVEWLPGWLDRLARETRYDFISQPRGDQCMAFRIEALQKTGFFDERFSTLYFQEFDYFVRSVLHLRERASINDNHDFAASDTSWNPVGNILTRPAHNDFHEGPENFHTSKPWNDFHDYFLSKWQLKHISQAGDKKAFLARTEEPDFQYPGEINWYPFFWEGFEPIRKTFVSDYQPRSLLKRNPVLRTLGRKLRTWLGR